MIKCKLKCDKMYGGDYPLVDCDFISCKVLKEIVDKFTVNDVLEVTEDVVDYYNKRKTEEYREKFPNSVRTSCKTANSIISNLRKYIKIKEKNKYSNKEEK